MENNKWVEYTSKDEATGKTIEPIFKDGGAMTAVWNAEEGTLEFANVKDAPEGKLKFDLNTQLKSLAFVPARIFDGLGLITVWEVYAPSSKLNSTFPFINRKAEGSFVATAPLDVTYRLNPQNVDPAKYDWSFINRKVYTKATADDNDLVSIVTGPVRDGKLYDFTIKLNKAVEAADHGKINDIVALKAVAKDPSTVDAEFENIVSDYSYIEKDVNKEFYIIHKDGEFLYHDKATDKDVTYTYDKTDPKYYRWEKYVEMTDPSDFNGANTDGIDTPAPGAGKNPKAIALPYNGQVDLLNYVETYAKEFGDIAAAIGITPTYTFEFAGVKDGSTNVVISSDPDKAPYLVSEVDKTNQNKFLKFSDNGSGQDGKSKSLISVNDEFVYNLSPAIGRTPLVYVQALYDGKVLAECLIKIEITAEAAEPVKNLGWDVFLWHNATFKFDNLTATATAKGESCEFSTPHANAAAEGHGNKADKEACGDGLVVGWDEVNVYVLNDDCVNMSYEIFGTEKYDLANPQLILAKDDKGAGVEPKDLPAKEDAILVGLGDINTYYNKNAAGLAVTSQSPGNWKNNTNIVDLTISSDFDPLNNYDVHNVYVLYPAKDNTKNIDVVVKFSFKILPHEHDWTILKKYDDKNYWILNPDYILGTQDLLIEEKPELTDYYGTEPYVTYGGVRVKGLENDLRSAFNEHFKEYAKVWQDCNEKSDYTFTIVNYKADVVDIVPDRTSTTTVGTNADGYAFVTISGADLKAMGKGDKVTPYIFVRKPAGLNVGQDILVEVKETCTDITDGPSIFGYYYVVFEAIKPTIKFNEVKLGDFKDQNDYALISEIVKGVYESDAADAVALFEWVVDETTKVGEWKLGPSAATYGITDVTKIVFQINKLIYDKTPKDTEASFKERLSIFKAGDTLTPTPTSAVPEAGLDWRNDGTNLEQDKLAGFELEILYDSESLTKGEGEVTVMKTGSKAHPNHKADGSIWED